MKKLLLSIMISLFLSACKPATTIIPSETLGNEQDRTPTIYLSRTPTREKTKFENFPTDRPTPSKTMTPTIPIATVIAIGTIDAAKKTCNNINDPNYFGDSQSLSPNGDWVAVICDPKDTMETFTKIIELDTSKEWIISFADTSGKYLNTEGIGDGIPKGMLAPYKWSKDGRYLYLGVHAYDYGGDGPMLPTTMANGLLRFDLSSGNLEDFFPYYTELEFQISPDEKYLATAGGTIEILDLESGKEFDLSIPDNYFDLGFIDWSPDSKKLVFSTVKEQWYEQKEGFTLYLYDFESLSLKKLIANDMNFLSDHKWISNTVFESVNFFENNHFKYDIETNTLTPLENP